MMNAKVFKMHYKAHDSKQDELFSLNCFLNFTTRQLQNRQFYIFNSESTFDLETFLYYEIKF